MRPRALVFLLVLTAGDYLLWNWSIADGHDVVSLVAGLTLLPLAAVSIGGLVLSGARMVAGALERSSVSGRAQRASRQAAAAERARRAASVEADSSSSSSSSRLAA